MIVAIIGYPGAGKSTLATGLSGLLGGRTVRSLEAAWSSAGTGESLLLDGVPRNVDELDQLIAHAGDGVRVDHYLYLDTPIDVRIERISRMIAAGFTEPADERDRMLHPDDLGLLLKHLESTGQLTTIKVGGRSRTDVLNAALDVLDVRI